MFIQTEATPKPGHPEVHSGQARAARLDARIPLGGRGGGLRRWPRSCSPIHGVSGVFLGHDFMTVSRKATANGSS